MKFGGKSFRKNQMRENFPCGIVSRKTLLLLYVYTFFLLIMPLVVTEIILVIL